MAGSSRHVFNKDSLGARRRDLPEKDLVLLIKQSKMATYQQSRMEWTSILRLQKKPFPILASHCYQTVQFRLGASMYVLVDDLWPSL